MRVPISYALHHPERVDVPRARRSTSPRSARSPSSRVDLEAFPCLRLAREAASAGGTAPCVLNAANEVAVHAFLDGRLPFLGIADGDRGDARRGSARAPCARSSRSTRPIARRARSPPSWWRSGGAPSELAPRLRRLRRADHPARVRPLHRRPRRSACASSASRCSSRRCCSRSRRGETEYGIGAIPLGGYVQITGMNPDEEIAAGGRATAPTTASRCGSGSS